MQVSFSLANFSLTVQVNDMNKSIAFCLATLAATTITLADIQVPNKPGPTRKLGSGIAKTAFSSAYLADSFYDKLQFESGTSAFSYGVVEGVGKTAYSTLLGVLEVITFPFPKYEGFDPKYPTTTKPPADLYDNFY
jgi:putative exosortase-associated protein (TIGR04073 family)